MLATVDPILATPINLTDAEFDDLTAFVRNGLQDKRVNKENLCRLIPDSVPSGRPLLKFVNCPKDKDK